MFKHILVPVDDSDLSRHAAQVAIDMARACNASVTALSVELPERAEPYIWSSRGRRAGEGSANIDRCLTGIQEAADVVGVPCTCSRMQAGEPWDAIVQAAREKDCDLIVMGSHGRRGVTRLLLGSETQAVLSHTGIPVLVCPA